MRVLITGGSGFIGSHTTRRLTKSPKIDHITNLDNLSEGSSPRNLDDLENKRGYTLVKGDIREPDDYATLLRETDCIINAAAQTHVDRSISNPELFIETNTVGTHRLLESARKHDVERFIQVSTDEVYGEAGKNASFMEEDPLSPSNPYSASKAAADLLVKAYHRTYGLHTVITRSTNNFGPHQHPEKLIPKTIIRTLKGLPVPVYGSGDQVRDWIYVLDHAEALERILFDGKTGETYNISAGNYLTNLEVVRLILKTMEAPRDRIQHVRDRPGHDSRYSLDSTKLREQLGWKPRNTLEEAMQATVEWYVQNKWWWLPLADERALHPQPWTLQW